MSSLSRITIYIIIILTGFLSLPAQKIFMTGDSHVFSKIYPQKIEEIFRTEHPEIEFSWWAKNGICFYSFNSHPEYFDSIFAFRPDILIVHLGTNGAYANNFSREAFRHEMENFYSVLVDSLPEVKVVFVTPFTNKRRKYRKKGKWYVNNNNRAASDEIISFVNEHPSTYFIDNNAEAGTKFLESRTLTRPDNVHLTALGYNILGEEVGAQLLKLDNLWIKPDLPDGFERD